MKRQQFNNKLKQIAMKNIDLKPAKLISNELSNHEVDTVTPDDIKLIRKNMYRIRSCVLSKLKKNV